jgi:death-on-curing family protein
MLFYLMIKNHPFQNGNKRIAMTTLFVFLYKNKKWLRVDTQELYNFTVWVASSPPKVKTQTVKAIESFLQAYIVDL